MLKKLLLVYLINQINNVMPESAQKICRSIAKVNPNTAKSFQIAYSRELRLSVEIDFLNFPQKVL